MHDLAGLQIDDYKDVNGSEKQIVDNNEITSPGVTSVVLQEGSPGLTCFLRISGMYF